MPDPQTLPKTVMVHGLGVVEFPSSMPDDEISSVIKKHKSQTHKSADSPHATGKITEKAP